MSHTNAAPESDPIAQTIAANLSDMLKSNRWSRRSAAMHLGLTPMYVNRRASGEVECTGSDLKLFADLFGVTVERFYMERDAAPVTTLDPSKNAEPRTSDYGDDVSAKVTDITSFIRAREAS